MKGINVKMIPICLFSLLWHVGIYMTFPYLTMQMIQMGLTMEDVSIVYGITPLVTLLSPPLSGYIGDKIGYRTVLIGNIFVAGLSSTAFDWTPRTKEYIQQPFLNTISNQTLNQEEIMEFWWPLQCNNSLKATENQCQEADILQNPTFWLNVQDYFCHKNGTIDQSDIPNFDNFEVVRLPQNGTFCKASYNYALDGNQSQLMHQQFLCNLNDIELSTFSYTEGSHSKTFWVYFSLRMLYQFSMQSVYSAYEGTAINLCHEFNSDFTWVYFFGNIGSVFGPFLAAWTITDAVGNGGENDYSLAFYVFDGFLIGAIILSLMLKVTMVDSESEKRSLSELASELLEILNAPAILFFGILFYGGIMWGIHDTYLLLYLQDELKASSQLLSYFNVIGSVTNVLIMPLAQWIIDKVGHIHIIYSGIIIECARLALFSWIKQSPPNYAFALALLQCWTGGLYWASAVKYGYIICPPTLVGTMTGFIASINWIIAKGLASFVAGQLIAKDVLNISQTFQYFSAACILGVTILYVFYCVKGRKLERDRAEKVEQIRLELFNASETDKTETTKF